MRLTVVNANPAVPLWTHFLLRKWTATVETRVQGAGAGQPVPVPVGPSGFTADLAPGTAWLRLVIDASVDVDRTTYPLLRIQQEFTVTPDGRLVPLGWRKGPAYDPLGRPKGIPALHPLLDVTGSTVALDVRFVDITDLYNALHGRSAWAQVMNLLRGTDRTIRALASLGGHPLVWYAVLPASTYTVPRIKPAVMIMPADYGAISYDNSLAGLRSSLHRVSAALPNNYIQSGLEILARVLTEPLTDDRYEKLLGPYIALRKTFRGDPAALPGPLHHFRGVLSYLPGKDPEPQYWDVPLGFERAIHDEKYVLLVPVMNGGEGGVLLRSGLDDLTAGAVAAVYTHGTALDADTLTVDKPVVMAYSQAGGNAFTSAGNNLGKIGGLVLFETVYTNEFPRDATNHRLLLGKDVIPKLLQENVKVVVIGRWRERPRDYLPDGKILRGITVFPDAANYYLLDYPLPPDGRLASAHPVVAFRYSRLVNGKQDKALDLILGSDDPAHIDDPTAQSEAAVEASIAAYRKAGLSDEAIVRQVFSAKYLPDDLALGGFYQHNLILAGGQHLDTKTRTYRGFVQEALRVFGAP
ncbi:hypothetical protein [Streptomyces acidiscabies]|uniref:hypothetical protein n=1 Tax=Streptomyces acidiscabies TaxID=42234 RepID=UPI0038F6A2DB